jgi:glutaredoxin
MKKLIIIALLIASYKLVDVYFLTPSLIDKNAVVLYSAEWCGYCKKVRKLLNDNAIAFIEYDIEKSEEGLKQYIELGVRVLPATSVYGEAVAGYNPEKILDLAKR